MAILRIPTPLRPYAGGHQQLDVKANNVAGAMDELITAHPELKQHLFTEAGELRAFVNLFVNDENVRDLQGTQTPLKPTDSLMILPSIAGGALLPVIARSTPVLRTGSGRSNLPVS